VKKQTSKRAKSRPKIVPAYCSKCDDYLAGVPVHTTVFCPNCNIWSVALLPVGKARLIDYSDPKTIHFERNEANE